MISQFQNSRHGTNPNVAFSIGNIYQTLLKSSAVDVATSAIEGIGLVLGTTLSKREIDV